eukprot:2912418-Prymnesium_polylepis.1
MLSRAPRCSAAPIACCLAFEIVVTNQRSSPRSDTELFRHLARTCRRLRSSTRSPPLCCAQYDIARTSEHPSSLSAAPPLPLFSHANALLVEVL